MMTYMQNALCLRRRKAVDYAALDQTLQKEEAKEQANSIAGSADAKQPDP